MNVATSENPKSSATNTRGAIISSPFDRHWIRTIPGERVAIRIHSTDVGGRYTIMDQSIAPMSGPPLHSHEQDEIFEVLEGTMTFVCGDDCFEAAADSIIVIPAGMAHTWANLTDEQTSMRVIFSPGGLEGMFKGLDGTSREALEPFSASYGTRLLGPGIIR